MNQPDKNWIVRHKFLSLVIILCAVLVILISAKSAIATYYVRDFFKQHASDVAIEDLTINLIGSDFTITGLKTRHANGQQLNIDSLHVDWQFGGLLDNHVTINKLALNGVRLDIESDKFTPVQIGPLLLANLQNPEAETEVETESEPWSIALNGVELNDITVCLDDSSVLYKELGLPVVRDTEKLGVCLTIESLGVAGMMNLDKNAQFSYQEDINLAGVKLTTSENEPVLTLAGLALDDLSLDAEQLSVNKITLDAFSLLANENSARHATLGASLDELSIDNFLTRLDGSESSFNEVAISKLLLRVAAADNEIRPVVEVDGIQVLDFAMSGENINLAKVSISDAQFLENYTNPDQDQEYLAKLSNFSVSELSYNPVGLKIIGVKAGPLDSLLSVDSNGLNVANWLPATTVSEETGQQTIEAASPEAKPLSFALQNLSVESVNIRILDNLTDAPIEHQIKNIKLELKDLDSTKTTEMPPASLLFELGLGDNGLLSGEGTMRLFNDQPEVNVTGKLDTMDLVNVSHLATRYIGYRIDRGIVSLDYRVALKDEMIDAELNALFEKFALANLEENEKSPLNEDLGLPLPMALNLLRDSDDNIELDLPISGNVNSPDFSAGSIVSTVMVKAIKNAVLLNYSPLGMLTLASGVFDLATALRFDPVVFEPRDVTLPAEADEQLGKIIKLMQEKPKVKMVICGVATEVDYPEQQPVKPTVSEAVSNEPSITTSAPGPDPMELLKLAQQRQDNVINYIVNTGGIDATRLIGCNVKMAKKKDAKPIVEISI